MKIPSLCVGGLIVLSSCNTLKKEDRPNILWIILDDTGLDFSCYGNTVIQTPVVDSLARNGILFTNMHVTSPVCSPSRSAMVTGMYQTSNGTHNHRSSRGKVKIFLDEDKPTIPELFRHHGYYTANVGYDYNPKLDYNFIMNPAMYDTLFRVNEENWVSPWGFRGKDQPFFIQVQLEGGKNRRVNNRYPVDPAKCSPAPYYPNDSLFYHDQASYHSSTLHVDKLIGDIMAKLKEEGLDKNTVVMILGDNGQDNYRDKQWLYEGGTHVPFIVYGPQKYLKQKGVVRDDLAIHIDMAPASLRLAGIDIPAYLEGLDWFAKGYKERDYIVTARDRCDWTKDRIRVVRTKDHKYVRNFYPEYAYMQSNYRDEWLMVVRAKEMHEKGELNPVQARFFEPSRPSEEFYLVKVDSFEIDDQVNIPLYREDINKYRKILDDWIKRTGDQGQFEESTESYADGVRHVNQMGNNEFPLVAGFSRLFQDRDSGSFRVYLTNVTNQELLVETRIDATRAYTGFTRAETLKIAPGEQVDFPVNGKASSVSGADSINVHISTTYRFNQFSTQPYQYSYILKPIEKHLIPGLKVKVDGRLDEWDGYLSHVFRRNQPVRFGIARDDSHVYIGVMVNDPEVHASTGKNPWEQDGIEIRVDGRPDPHRSSSIGTEDFFDHLLVAMSPSGSGDPVSKYFPANSRKAIPELFVEGGLQYKCRVVPGGYTAEVAIPQSYLEELQGDWRAIRVNIIVHDKSKNGLDRTSWQPRWGSPGDYAGSGTFFRE